MFYKEIGTDQCGAVKVGNKWLKYNCLHCARKLYPSEFRERTQGPPNKSITKALRGPILVFCSGNH